MEKCTKQKILSPEHNHSSPQPHLSSQRESLLLFCVFFKVFLFFYFYFIFVVNLFVVNFVIH